MIQLSLSSRAIHGGAYFSDVSGWNSIPISVPGPCEVTECNRLLGFCLTITFCLNPAHLAVSLWNCRVLLKDLLVLFVWICYSWQILVVSKTGNPSISMAISIGNGLLCYWTKSCCQVKTVHPIPGPMLRRFYSTNRNRFSSRNGREISSPVHGTTRFGQL